MNRLQKVELLLEEAEKEGFANGVAEGLAVAERIYNWFTTNHTLKDPVSLEVLKDWSSKELETLKSILFHRSSLREKETK